MIRFRVGTATHEGRVRDHNEDSLGVTDRVVTVADGMGGHAAGEVASQLAVERFSSAIAAVPSVRAEDLVAAVEAANAGILESSALNSEQAGMGTTLCSVAVISAGGSDHWAVLNVGDSRVYRLRGDALVQISVDHSEVSELVAAGRLTPDEARRYARRNVVTRSLGTDPGPAPDIWVLPPIPGDRFLLCTDGLTNEVDDSTIAGVLIARRDPQAAAVELVERAVDAGGRDNVTVAVVDLVADEQLGRDGYDTAPRPNAAEPDADSVSFDPSRFDPGERVDFDAARFDPGGAR